MGHPEETEEQCDPLCHKEVILLRRTWTVRLLPAESPGGAEAASCLEEDASDLHLSDHRAGDMDPVISLAVRLELLTAALFIFIGYFYCRNRQGKKKRVVSFIPINPPGLI